MNAHTTTAIGMATALMGKPRVEQTVHVAARSYGHRGLIYPLRVLVVPKGVERGQYWAVHSDGVLRALQAGTDTPEDLELELFEEAEEVA